MKRILWDYKNQVPIPTAYQQFLWDYPGKTAPLEMLILRILIYGSFRDLRWLYNKLTFRAGGKVNSTIDLLFASINHI